MTCHLTDCNAVQCTKISALLSDTGKLKYLFSRLTWLDDQSATTSLKLNMTHRKEVSDVMDPLGFAVSRSVRQAISVQYLHVGVQFTGCVLVGGTRADEE